MKFKMINKRDKIITLQLLGWGVILAVTIFWSMSSGGGVIDSFGLIVLGINILTLIIIYMLNYLFFIPRYLFQKDRARFLCANIALLTLLLAASYFFNEMGFFSSIRPADMPPRPRGGSTYLLRDLINYVMMVGLVTAVRLAERLELSEAALREAEGARVKAELDNLRSQINPHFLLNTLNNIYALTSIDTEKAQKTIKELSNLLRYILYDNKGDMVSLRGEVEFLKTYIELMSIRLPRKVALRTQFKISESSDTQIAPLIFISLIENAFKHSVSAEGEGFINIYFEDNVAAGEVILEIENSNHAKAEQDKSGHGIGLEQVRRRLLLLYPASHTWEVKCEGESYRSRLILKQRA